MSRSRRPGPSTRVRVHEVRAEPAGEVIRHEDRLATEEPLEIRLAWPGRPARRVAVTMRTPGHDFELAAGFLHAEGLVSGVSDLHTAAYCTDHTLTPEEEFNVVTVTLTGPPPRDPTPRYDGPTAATSACGVCGTQSIDDVLHLCDVRRSTSWDGLRVAPDVLLDLPNRMREQQRVFASTGGLHASGLFDTDGTLTAVREDIGRHNTVDKVVGSRLLAGAGPGAPVLCVSGRIGFEIVQKAVAANVGVVAAVGAPSSLAIRLAQQAGLCAVGFVGRGRFVVYTAPDRIGV